MKKRNSQSKYSIASLLLLLAIVFYLVINPDQAKQHEETPQDEPFIIPKKVKKPKQQPKELRHLTVFEGKVIGIKDGDTFEVLYDGQPERVRLADIDCPEKQQPFGNNARQYASQLCFGKTVTVSSSGERDRYKRVIGTVITSEGINVNEALVKAGMAWHYKQYSKNAALGFYQDQAKAEKIGLWQDKNPIAPWNWRKHKRKMSQQAKTESQEAIN